MLNSKEYDRYKFLKKKLAFKDRDIELSAAMAINILEVSFEGSKLTPKIIFPDFFRILDVSTMLNEFKTSDVVFTDATVREDHLSLLELIRKGVTSSYIRIPTLKRKLKINPYIIFTSYLFITRQLKSDCSLIERLYLTGKLTYYRNVLKQLTDIFSGQELICSKYVAFHSPFGIESLLVQFFSKLNINTYTLSHGLSYVSYKQLVPRDMVNGENIVADKVFVLGHSSKVDLVNNFKINVDRIIVGGNPKYPSKNITPKQGFKKCLVMMGRKIYHESNLDILNIVGEVGQSKDVEFFVKLHPSLDFDYYSRICSSKNIKIIDGKESLIQTLNSDKYDFAIVNNSTAYYESMYYNLLCFRYFPSENEEFLGLDDKFSTVSDLMGKIEYYKKIDTSVLASQVQSLLEETLGMGISTYKDILSSSKFNRI